ncbi:MAG TPA: MFS transporter [Candidatus Baltobacteraceae bacterium]|jgi:FSR family fosmidomycin resistance protein-like MFS transporter|nr:MFS transporter [Candidatus Baltobacteraceae bacterium]
MDRRAGWHLRGLLTTGFAHGVSDFYSGMVPLLIFTIVSAHHLSPLYQGAIGFLWYLTSSIVQPLFGAYSDRSGRWWFLPVSVGLTAFAVSAIGISANIPMLCVLVIAGGIGSAVMHPEAGKYAALLSGDRKSGGISIFQIGGAAGYAAGPVVIASIIARFGTAGSLWMLVPGVLSVAMLAVLMHGINVYADREKTARESALSAAAKADSAGVALLVGGTALRYLTGAAFMTYLPNLIVARGGSIADAGAIVTAFLAVGAVGLYAGGWLGDRFGAVAISVLSLLLAVPALIGFFAFSGAAGLAALLLGNALLNIQSAPSVAIVQQMLPRNLGMALGLMNGVAFGAGSALVTAVGFGVARAGAAQTLLWVGMLPVFCAAAYWIAGRRVAVRSYASAASNAAAS